MLGQSKNESVRLAKFEEDLINKERKIQVGLSIEMETAFKSLSEEIKDKLQKKGVDKKEAEEIADFAFEVSKNVGRMCESLRDFEELKDFQRDGSFLEKINGEERTIIYFPSGETFLREVMGEIEKIKAMKKFFYQTNADALQIARLKDFITKQGKKIESMFSYIVKRGYVPVSKLKKDGDIWRPSLEPLK
jgi:predicted GNAT family acetyltransferase